ncbi:hypothetical protein BXU06_09455 [Aquaspirillum sp. LM1]|uniref:hypothetical protein n=1 Tax=Aquaspirillum sp. LM1 TaxID=1938604 RepID=UPI000983C231|nr:hypothetical protein [Aquaspirillum sp. LM1]AQR65253.1 hypothetical protein BXU06_09455 [Aquaspirillum sp. LM1]
MLRFDQTDLFPNQPPGDVFHQFVSEFFADATPDLRSFQAPGKDGAIDLYSPSQGCVWECKYVAQDGWDAVQPRWAEVAKHLRDNLLDHAPKQKQYQPWYNSQTPIRRYRFCTSARLSNQGQCDALAGQIRQQFQELAQRAGLAHLDNIAVEIFTWDDFASQLAPRHALRTRWFPPDLPTGYRSLSRELARTRPKLHQYLYHSSTLRYVPVSSALSPAAQLEALEQRIADNSQFSSVLHGRGGAGKSRLQWEIGLAAQQAGWRVWLLDAHLAQPDQLAEALREPCAQPTLLLMDYIERCDSWDNWLYALQAAADHGARVHLLGACRNSWLERLDPWQTAQLALPDVQPDTVQGILRQRDGLLDFADVCGGVPVFAVFLCLLADQQRHAELSALRGAPDFRRWLSVHLARLPDGQPEDMAGLVELLISLPGSDAARQALEAATPSASRYRHQLLHDGWLLETPHAPPDERWSTLHDVLADGALLNWLHTTTPRIANGQVQRWLHAAAARGQLRTQLRSWQRVATEASVQALDWPTLLTPPAQHADIWCAAHDAILNAGLLSPLAALRWLAARHANPHHAASTPAVHLAVANAAKAWQTHPAQTPADHAMLIGWLDALSATLTGHGAPAPALLGNHALVQALRCDPARYASAAESWLAQHHEQEQAQFLLNVWLKHQPHPTIAPLCLHWLRRHGHKPVASFVLKAWLDAGGEREPVRAAVLAWLAQHPDAAEARFVLTAWLDASGEREPVRAAVLAWLAQHPDAAEACFVLTAWLDAGGEREPVRAAVLAWLAQHSDAAEACFVLKAWLDAGGEREPVRAAVLAWLAQHSDAAEACFVLTAWLDAGGEREPVRAAVLAWLAQHPDAAEAQFVLTAWLDAGGEREPVRAAVLAWLAQHPDAAEARFVLKAWLDASGEREPVEAVAQHWFARPGNALSDGAGFLLRAYGDHSRHLPPWLHPYACTWLECHWQQPDAVYALKYIVKIRPLPASTVEAGVAWCVRHANDPDAVFRLAGLPVGALAVASDRTALLADVATVLVAQLPKMAASHISLQRGLLCLANVWRLRGVTVEAQVLLAQAACQVVRLLADGQLAKRLAALHMPDKVARLLASTNWATLLPLGAPAHADPLLHQGEQALLQCCDAWAAAPAR